MGPKSNRFGVLIRENLDTGGRWQGSHVKMEAETGAGSLEPIHVQDR